MFKLDEMIVEFDKGLRTLFAAAPTIRTRPDAEAGESEMGENEKRLSAALMRVNHSGEICAQALYQGQALTARNPDAKAALERAAQEETEHLNWCETRIQELGGHKSFLNPLWYVGSLGIGALAGALGDKWNLGFLAETEHQVEHHLEGHLQRLPEQDSKSRAILEQMKTDEMQHATTAVNHGGAELPEAVKMAMKLSSKVMTRIAYWI